MNDFAGDNMVLEDTDRTCNTLNLAMEKKVDTMLYCEMIRVIQLGLFRKVKCVLDDYYSEILDDADPLRIEMPKPSQYTGMAELYLVVRSLMIRRENNWHML